MIVAGVLGVVWRLFSVCLEGFWRVSGLEGVWSLRKVSVGRDGKSVNNSTDEYLVPKIAQKTRI